MNLHCSLADSKIDPDDFVHLAIDDTTEHLMFTFGQGIKPVYMRLLVDQLIATSPVKVERLVDSVQQFLLVFSIVRE